MAREVLLAVAAKLFSGRTKSGDAVSGVNLWVRFREKKKGCQREKLDREMKEAARTIVLSELGKRKGSKVARVYFILGR